MGIQVYRDISVDFSTGRYILINAKQHDSKSRFIRMTCTNMGQKVNLNPTDYSAFIRYRKSDGYGVFNKCIISTKGEVIFELTEQMLSTVGTSYADLVVIDIAKSDINNDLTIISADGRIIENNSSLASTMTFYINVLEKPLNDWDIESTNEFSALNELLLKASKDYEYIVNTTKEYMDNAKASEEAAAESANHAKESETNAKEAETNAKEFATNAETSQNKAYQDAIASYNSALISKSYAIGESKFLTNESWEEIITDSDEYIPVEVRPNEETENAKNYYKLAKESANHAKGSEDNAKISETNAKISETNAKTSEINAEQSEINAKDSETNAKISETNAKTSEINAEQSEINAKGSETNAKISETNAKASEEAAAESANNAKGSEDNAKISETNAENSSLLARSYTKGDTNIRPNEVVDCAEYYYQQSKQISEGLSGALLPMGTIQFSQLAIQTKSSGYMFNISDDFVSDDTFKDGGGIPYPAGTNVYYTADGFWDCLAGNMVSGVKGNAEENYRKGYVNLTPENIGTYSKEEIQDITLELLNRIKALEELIESGDITITTKIVDNESSAIVTDKGEMIIITDNITNTDIVLLTNNNDNIVTHDNRNITLK